jgi:hypothetical protein
MSQATIFKKSIKFGSVVLAKQDECVGPFFEKSIGSVF